MIEVALFSSSIVLFVAYLVTSLIIYKKREGENYDFRNHFPFELWIKRNDSSFTLNIFLFIPILAAAVNYILFAINFYDVPNVVAAFFAVVICFAVAALFIIPLSKLKEHCILAILLLTASAVLNGFLVYKEIKNWQLYNDYLIFIPLVINILCGASALLFMFHPALFRFDMKRDEEGKLYRPHSFIMVLSEWIMIFSLFLSQIAIVVIRFIG